MAGDVEVPKAQTPSAVLGTSIHEALRLAAFEAYGTDGRIVTTDNVIRHLVAQRADDVRRLIASVPESAEPTPYRSIPSLHDGPPPSRSSATVAFEVEATLREVAWRTTRLERHPTDRQLVWTDGLRAVLSRTLDKAGAAGVTRANAAHLVLAALSDPAHRAIRVYPYAYAAIVARLTGDRLLTENGQAHPPPAALIARARGERDRRWSRRLRRRLTRRLERIARYSPLWWEVEYARRRYAVRLHHTTITVAHTVLALLDVHERLTQYGVRLPDGDCGPNTAGLRLVEASVTIDDVVAYAREVGDNVELADVMSIRTRLGTRRWNDPLWSRAIIVAEQRAEALALAAHHPDTGTTHLLAGMLAAAPGETSALLDAVGADVDGLAAQIQNDLDRIPPAWHER